MVFAPDIDAAASQNYESKGGFFSGGKRTNKKFYENLSKKDKKKEREKAMEILGEGGLSAIDRFKKSQGMTDTNPYGNQGFFTRVFGINPNKMDYSRQIPSQGIQNIISSKFDQFIDPFQAGIPDAGQIGTERGALKRPIKKGQMTGFGIASAVPRQQSGKEVLARALFSKASPFGLPLAFLDTKEQMIEGSPEFTERLSEGPQGSLGYINRAITPLVGGADIPSGISTLRDSLREFFRGGKKQPTNTNQGTMSPSERLIDSYKKIEDRPPSKNLPFQNLGLGQFMNIVDLNIDEFNNSDLREILRTGVQNRGSLFGIREQLFDLMMKNQKSGVPNFAIDGPKRV
tara:strand:+ start:3294 stop:4328 length:1035 start_codon:yes stop_codon:yes gene_type:complete